MSGVMDGARTELLEAEGQLNEAASILREKAAEAKRVQKRMHKINSKISGLIAAQEAVPHRQALARLHEYQKLRTEVVEVEQAHADLVEKLEDRKQQQQHHQQQQQQQQQQLSLEDAGGGGGGGRYHRTPPGSAGTPRGGGKQRGRPPKQTSRVASDAIAMLDRIALRHREQADVARDHVQRLEARKELQRNMTAATLTACTNNELAVVQELLREQTAHAAVHPDTRDQYTVMECKDVEGRRPLHYVCCHGCYEVGMLLLTSGADPQIACDTGFTPMHFAGREKRPFLSHFMVAGNDYFTKTGSGQT
jgi:vacuolar-type H+-ATPase subunit I/STV1